ncbi:TPA_asm: hypothetical protein [Porphyromonas phage phage028a_KCOM2799]|uniref:Uncharacterized protein n=1 Tax=Porphyromonas phage phage028a_KCOM2799 TaxID=3154118 RepID=A0AAT9JED3_9CAUD
MILMAVGTCRLEEGIASSWCISCLIAVEDIFRYSSSGEEGFCLRFGYVAAIGVACKIKSHLHRLALALLGALLVAHFRLGDPDACAICQEAHGFWEGDPLMLLHEGEDVAAFATAEALPHILCRAYSEGCVGVLMKGAVAFVVDTCSTERDELPYYFLDLEG